MFGQIFFKPESKLFEAFLQNHEVEELTTDQHWRQGTKTLSVKQQSSGGNTTYDAESQDDRFRFLIGKLAREFEFLRRQVLCHYCNTIYNACENLGTHACSYHPGCVSWGRFTCCSSLPGQRGCVPCDHSQFPPERYQARNSVPKKRWHEDNEFMKIPLEILTQKLIPIPRPEALINLTFTNGEDPVRSYIIICRTALTEQRRAYLTAYFKDSQNTTLPSLSKLTV